MYASSIFGWLRYIDRQVGTIQDTSPISTNHAVDPCTEASSDALMELTTLVEPLLRSVDGIQKTTDKSSDSAMKSILDTIESGDQPTVQRLPTPVGRQVQSSQRFKIQDGYVFVLVDCTKNAVNLSPVFDRVVDELDMLLVNVTDVIKFLDADDTEEAVSLSIRWKQIGGLLRDISKACRYLLRRVHHRECAATAVQLYAESTEDFIKNVSRLNND